MKLFFHDWLGRVPLLVSVNGRSPTCRQFKPFICSLKTIKFEVVMEMKVVNRLSGIKRLVITP
jgi:hypothetical protein